MMGRPKVTIYMRSGNRVRVRVKRMTVTHGSSGDVTSMEWEGRAWMNRRLSNVVLSQIEAVVFSRW
jgi:hypothetical protein